MFLYCCAEENVIKGTLLIFSSLFYLFMTYIHVHAYMFFFHEVMKYAQRNVKLSIIIVMLSGVSKWLSTVLSVRVTNASAVMVDNSTVIKIDSVIYFGVHKIVKLFMVEVLLWNNSEYLVFFFHGR